MPANQAPIFALIPVTSFVSGAAANAATPGVTANTTKDLSSGTIYGPVFTAGLNGSRVDYLRLRPLGTNSSATVCRVFLNNGNVTTTAANNTLFTEATIASTTNSETAALVENTINVNVSLPPNYRVYLTFGTAQTNGHHVTAVGGDY